MYNNAIDGVSASGRSLLLRQPAGERGRRPRSALAARVARVLPAESRAVPRVDARVHLRAGSARRDLRQPVRLERRRRSTIGGNDVRLSVRSDDAVGRPIDDRAVDDGRHARARSSCAFLAGRAIGPRRAGSIPTRTRSIDRRRSSVNGASVSAVPDDGRLRDARPRCGRTATPSTSSFPIAVRTRRRRPRVKESAGRVAIERGPIVYCAEWPEADGRPRARSACSTRRARRRCPTAGSRAARRSFTCGRGACARSDASVKDVDAHSVSPVGQPRRRRDDACGCRRASIAVGDVGPAGGLIFYVNPTHATDGWRFLEAAPVDQSGGAKWGCFRTAIAGARGTAVGTGRQNTRDMLAQLHGRGDGRARCAPTTA